MPPGRPGSAWCWSPRPPSWSSSSVRALRQAAAARRRRRPADRASRAVAATVVRLPGGRCGARRCDPARLPAAELRRPGATHTPATRTASGTGGGPGAVARRDGFDRQVGPACLPCWSAPGWRSRWPPCAAGTPGRGRLEATTRSRPNESALAGAVAAAEVELDSHGDDTRAAIIAAYLAMERQLVASGTDPPGVGHADRLPAARHGRIAGVTRCGHAAHRAVPRGAVQHPPHGRALPGPTPRGRWPAWPTTWPAIRQVRVVELRRIWRRDPQRTGYLDQWRPATIERAGTSRPALGVLAVLAVIDRRTAPRASPGWWCR